MLEKVKRKTKQIGFVIVITFGLFWLFVLYTQLTLPNAEILKIQNPETTAFMERYKGEKPLQYAWVPYSQISPHLKEAVVTAEDSSFFQHSGFDWQAITEAFQKNWRKKKIIRGGSTITQQLAKNLYLSPSKNPFRKLKEILITIQLEQQLSKQRILEIYLNVVEWGDGIYGAEAAAKHYYNTKAGNVTASQASWLAAILPNPKFYEKHRASRYAQSKADRILSIMGYRKAEKEKGKEVKPESMIDETSITKTEPAAIEPTEAMPMDDTFNTEDIPPEEIPDEEF